jgi:hypothetical protein
MKTAVEWLVENIDWQLLRNTKTHYNMIVEQAKEMEKEQIRKSFSDGAQWELYGCDLTYEERSEEYYNEIFKQEQ